ncbi:MAG TPA: DegQ family serine endoprotease [Gammaproteobacteria bacterium]|nr:DegQ family serine endoprotease [Gammaproteobacteria bacterium]
MERLRRIAVVAVLTLVAGLVGAAGPASAAIPAVANGEDVPSLAPMIQKVSPAVVNISTKGSVKVQSNPLMQDPFFRHFFNMPNQQQQQKRQFQALGSGVIVDADKGYILTNHHVIAHADEIRVRLQDDREFDAKVIGSDPETDIALIQIKADNLKQLPMADSSKLRVGDFVVAIGNPFGLDHTVTTGVVSGLGRTLRGGEVNTRLQNFIQTDASINPGNSGGALVNLKGQLVGINSAILSRSGGNIGIGFAIPINMAQDVMQQLEKYGEVRRGMLGVRVQDLTPDMAKALDLNVTEGALVAQVAPDSSAEKAGIKQGDVITSVNGKDVTGANQLANTVGLMQIGQKVKLGVVRDGKHMTIDAKVGKPPTSEASAGGAGASAKPLQGAQFSNLDQRSPLYGKVQGVLVTNVEDGSPASDYLQAGDVITSVNRQPVSNLDDFRKAIKGKEKLLLNIRRGDAAMFVLVQ